MKTLNDARLVLQDTEDGRSTEWSRKSNYSVFWELKGTTR